jgi:Putative 2OG-Fe(II) oxygenase
MRDALAMPDFSAAAFGHLFPAPFMAFVWPDGAELNEELRPRILAHASRSAGLEKSNSGGWHSEIGQLEFCGDAGRRLVRHMYEVGDEATRRTLAEMPPQPGMSRWTFGWTLHAWANVNGPGGFNRFHTHPGSTWSGVYYVDPGAPPTDSDEGTPLHFFDPCLGRANTFLQPVLPSRHSVRPVPGLMVLFPSYMPHMVFPHRGERERISIAFNLRKDPFP